jgi:hypothetical protein
MPRKRNGIYRGDRLPYLYSGGLGNTWEPVKRVVEDVSLFLLLRSTSTLCTRVGKGKTKTKGKSDSAKGKGSTEVQGIFRML